MLLLGANVNAQELDLHYKKVGIYLSSKSVSFDSDYYIWINQFLSLGDDRSWEDNQKAEFLIRLGQRWSAELQRITDADTVIFLNGDVELGKQYLREGAAEMLRSGAVDVVITLDSLSLATRVKRVNYIRSNKIYSSKRIIRKARMHSSVYVAGASPRRLATCFDEASHDFPPALIDVYTEASILGKFCSGLFSRWWLEVYAGKNGLCGENE